jgi:crotonobetainyl-CoA:carnitine CoA-transferase CaiB-like acyl-CoA transferase
MVNNESPSLKALEGIKIIDLSRVLAGPFCTMLLADMGAEVIKVEIPGKGDDSRSFPPFKNGQGTYFINFNRNKKSVVLDLKKSSDVHKFLKIVKSMDVLVENFRPGTMEKMGLGYERIKQVNNQLIYAAISGFGHYGPYKDKPGYDIIGQAVGGIMSITGWPDGPPTRTGTAIADILAALFCTIGILSALQARRIHGKGQKIDVALVDSVVSAIGTILQIYMVEKRIPKRSGNKYDFIAPYEAFMAKDGWFVLGVGNDNIWKKFCNTIDRKDLINDQRFNTNVERVKHNKELAEIIGR